VSGSVLSEAMLGLEFILFRLEAGKEYKKLWEELFTYFL
jgi:hypothetical protein